MATKLRLQRRGRKHYPFYQIVVADSRAPRDGKYIERIGSYNPNTHPATITLDFERALYWLQTGAQPTDTVRNILSDEGVLMKKHLLGGVTKGAFDEAEAERRFEAWKNNKQQITQSLKSKDAEKQRVEEKARLDAEKEVNKTRAEALAKKKTGEQGANASVAAVDKAEGSVEVAVEETPVAEAPVTEAKAEPFVEETPASEVKTEMSAEEVLGVEEKTEASIEVSPVKEVPVEETPVEEVLLEKTPIAEVKDETPVDEAPAANEETPAEDKEEATK